jgi:glycosyltransferase involved in cell wall biosynthesis
MARWTGHGLTIAVMLDLLPRRDEPLAATATGCPVHICVVTETYAPEINGVALTLARLVEGLRARGLLASVVRPRQAVDGAGEPGDPSLTLVRGLALPGYAGLQMGLPAGPILHDRWTRWRPDAIYVATEGPLGWSAVRVAHRLGVRVLSGFHTNFHGYARHYHARWLGRGVARYLRRFHNRTSGTLVPTADLGERLRAMGFRNVSVLGRGVDDRLFTPARRSAGLRRSWGVSDDELVVLYVGRLAPEKNVGLAIETYRAMQREGQPVRLVVVGDGPLRAPLQRAHPDVLFCGALTGEALAAHYASGDVFLFPSETETFGNVTLEALASGLAVVAYDYAAARIHIVDEQTGALVPWGDRQAFVERTLTLGRAPADLARMRRAARDSITRLAWDRVVERFEALLVDRHLSAAEGRHRR